MLSEAWVRVWFEEGHGVRVARDEGPPYQGAFVFRRGDVLLCGLDRPLCARFGTSVPLTDLSAPLG